LAGTGTARRFSDADKVHVYTVLAANGGNVKATVRETGVSAPTIRKWRALWETEGPPASAEDRQEAVRDFVQDAERIRNLAMAKLESEIASGEVKPQQLIIAIGVLDDKITRAKGMPDKRIERNQLPSPDEMRELIGGAIRLGIEAAERRHEEIVDAELVTEEPDPPALPLTTE